MFVPPSSDILQVSVGVVSILSNSNKYKKESFCLKRENTRMYSLASVATAMAHEHFG